MKTQNPVLTSQHKMLISTVVKPTQPKPAGVTVTPKDDGKAEWLRFKAECVLLKGAKQ